MPTFTRTRLALCAALAVPFTACTEPSAVDGARTDDGAPIRFRECPVLQPNCNLGNSPWVGSYAFSNFPIDLGEPTLDPYGLATFEMDSATKIIGGQQEDVALVVTELGRLRAEYASTEYDIAGTTFTFTIDPVGGTSSTGNLFIKSEDIPNTATYFDMPRYVVLTDIVPFDTETFPEDGELAGWYPVCPQAEGTNRAIALPAVALAYDGELAALDNDDLTLVLACERQALAKGATKLEVLPSTGNSVPYGNGTVNRRFGSLNYTALVNAYRAFYDGAARTTEGTTIYLKDVANDPPMFDQAMPDYLPPPPATGNDVFFLESVYGTSGASCRSYSQEFPHGTHRNSSYAPPGLMLADWDDMDDCGEIPPELAQHGSVAVYVVEHIEPS